MKIKIVPKKDHVEEVQKLYGKEITPKQFIVKIEAQGKTWNLKEDEWEEIRKEG